MILIIVLLALAVAFFHAHKRSELNMGKLIYHKEIVQGQQFVTIEKVGFENPVECIRNYNKLIAQLSGDSPEYALDSWTYNQVQKAGSTIELYRYGNYIRMTKTTPPKMGIGTVNEMS